MSEKISSGEEERLFLDTVLINDKVVIGDEILVHFFKEKEAEEYRKEHG